MKLAGASKAQYTWRGDWCNANRLDEAENQMKYITLGGGNKATRVEDLIQLRELLLHIRCIRVTPQPFTEPVTRRSRFRGNEDRIVGGCEG